MTEIRELFGSEFSLKTLARHNEHMLYDSSSLVLKAAQETLKAAKMSKTEMLDFGALEVLKVIMRLGIISEETLSLRANDLLVKALDTWIKYADRMDSEGTGAPNVVINFVPLNDEEIRKSKTKGSSEDDQQGVSELL